MDKKKLSTGFSLGALVAALVAIFMNFASAIKVSEELSGWKISIFDYMFKKGDMTKISSKYVMAYDKVYIVGFVLAILAILAIAAVLVMRVTNKGDAKLQKGLVIGAIVALVYVGVTAFFAKTAFIGEMKRFGEWAEAMKPYLHLGAGAIVSGIFGILGAGALVGNLVVDKK